MDHVEVSMDERETWATRKERLQACLSNRYNRRYLPDPDNQRHLLDPDNQLLDKIMDPHLYEAMKEGDADKFLYASEEMCQSRELNLSLIFDQVTPSGDSFLHVAASSGKGDVVELILTLSPYLMTRKNSSEDTPLHVAIRTRSLEATRKLIHLRRGLEIMYWKNKDSKSPLYLAVENCKHKPFFELEEVDREILQLLLEASARDEAYAFKIQGMSPVLPALQETSSGMLLEIVDRLPMLLHVRGEDGGTPLHSAASLARCWWAVDFLLERCPYLALQRDINGSYPIHIACQRKTSWTTSDLDTFDSILRHTWPDVAEIKNNKGRNILHVAAEAGNNFMVQHILEKWGEKLVNSKDVDGNTPLHLASMHNHCRVMLYLTRDNKIDLGLLNDDELTALDVAMKSKISSPKYSALLGLAILVTAGVPHRGAPDLKSQSDFTEWMNTEVNTRLIVATLVATVTFAAGFTFPGGYNASSDLLPGTATMLHNKMFQVFVIVNMLAMYSSILGVVVLLWGRMGDFYVARKANLIAGPLLLIALTSMSVAFLAGVIVAVNKLTWLAFLILSMAVIFLVTLVIVLGALIFPLSKITMRLVVLYCKVAAWPPQTRNDHDFWH